MRHFYAFGFEEFADSAGQPKIIQKCWRNKNFMVSVQFSALSDEFYDAEKSGFPLRRAISALGLPEGHVHTCFAANPSLAGLNPKFMK